MPSDTEMRQWNGLLPQSNPCWAMWHWVSDHRSPGAKYGVIQSSHTPKCSLCNENILKEHLWCAWLASIRSVVSKHPFQQTHDHVHCPKSSNQIKSSLFLISTETIFTQIQHVYTYERSTRKAGASLAWLPWHGKKSTQKTPFNSIIIIIIFTIIINIINNNYNNYIVNNQEFQPLLSTTPA